jgi:hypothetical protein
MVSAAVGEQILSVTDALDDQRDRNVVDHEFEELLEVLQLRDSDRRSVTSSKRDQKFGLVVFVARDRDWKRGRVSRAALDHELAAVIAFQRLQGRPGDLGRWLSRDGNRRRAADDVIARSAKNSSNARLAKI